MAKDCLYHAKKGDIPVVEGHCIYYLREQTLRGILSGEVFYKDGMDKFIAINADTKGNPYIYAAGYDRDLKKVTQFNFSKSEKFLRVKGVRFFTESELSDVARLEIRCENGGFSVYRTDGNEKLLNDFNTSMEAEEFCRNYRMRKFLEVA